MSAVRLNLPDALQEQVRSQAEKDNISFDEFVARAVAKWLSALRGEEYLRDRAGRGDEAKFRRVLSKIPDVEPEEHDRL